MEIKGTYIKKQLKEQGHDTKKISVRVNYVGYGSTSINVTIKDISVDIRAIESFLIKEYREIRYDEHVQGEILDGCNTFVFCDYDFDMFNNEVEKQLPLAEQLIEDFKKEDTYYGIDFFETDCFKAIAFYKDKLISIKSKDTEDTNHYRRHIFSNEYDLAKVLVTLNRYGNFGLA